MAALASSDSQTLKSLFLQQQQQFVTNYLKIQWLIEHEGPNPDHPILEKFVRINLSKDDISYLEMYVPPIKDLEEYFGDQINFNKLQARHYYRKFYEEEEKFIDSYIQTHVGLLTDLFALAKSEYKEKEKERIVTKSGLIISFLDEVKKYIDERHDPEELFINIPSYSTHGIYFNEFLYNVYKSLIDKLGHIYISNKTFKSDDDQSDDDQSEEKIILDNQAKYYIIVELKKIQEEPSFGSEDPKKLLDKFIQEKIPFFGKKIRFRTLRGKKRSNRLRGKKRSTRLRGKKRNS